MILFALLLYLNSSIIDNYKIDDKINVIYVGDSHIKLAINDKLINKSANFSNDSEAYEFSYYKIADLIRNNPNIKKIYLGMSYHNISNYYDDYVLDKKSVEIPGKYFFILPFSQKINLITINKNKLPVFIKKIFREGLNNIFTKTNNYGYLGKYENDFKNSKSLKISIDKRILFQFYKNGKVNDFSRYNINYLLKIVELCKKNRIELNLVNAPLHSYYRSKIPKIYISKYNDIILQNKLKVIDFKESSFSDNCFIPDGDHVSEKGSRIVSYLMNKNEN